MPRVYLSSTPSVTTSSSSVFFPTLHPPPSQDSLPAIYLWTSLSTAYISWSSSSPTHHASQEDWFCRAQEGRWPRILPRYVLADLSAPLHRVLVIWVSLWSRIFADSIHIDMIKDAIMSVSWSRLDQGWRAASPLRPWHVYMAPSHLIGHLSFSLSEVACWHGLFFICSIVERAQW